MTTSTLQQRSGSLSIVTDTHILPLLAQGDDNWSLFKPTTRRQMTLPRKPVTPSAPPSSPRLIGSFTLTSRNAEKMEEVCTFAPQELLRRASVSSDSSPPGMTDDQFGSSDSDASTEEDPYHATTSQIWNTYHDSSLARQKSLVELRRPQIAEFDQQEKLPFGSAAIIQTHRKYTSEHLAAVHLPPQAVELRRSSGRRSTRRAPDFLKTLPPAPVPALPLNPDKVYGSWPLRAPPTPLSLYPSTSVRGARARPSTAPAPSEKRGSPSSPSFPVVEKSVFEYDDDDAMVSKDGKGLASKLHMRSSSTGSKLETDVTKTKRRSLRRSASEVIKDIFGLGAKK